MSSEEKQRPALLRHALEQQPWRNQAQLATTLALIVVVGIIIGALYLIQTTTTTTTVRMLGQMDDQRAQLERDNERLNAEIAELQSLPRMMTRAAELGFHQAGEADIQYVIVDGYRYDRPRITPTFPPPPEAEEEPAYDDSFGGWLKQQWDNFAQQLDDWRNG